MQGGLPIGVHAGENPPVLPQYIVDVANEIGLVAVLPIVIGTSAIVRAEAFIRPASNFIATDDALFFRCFGHAE